MENIMLWWGIGIVLFFLVIVGLVVCVSLIAKRKKGEFAKNAKSIRLGMFKSDVITIMGDSYSRSYLRDGLEKLEWCYREDGSGVMVNGVFIVTEGVVARVSVIFQNYKVIEVNLDNVH